MEDTLLGIGWFVVVYLAMELLANGVLFRLLNRRFPMKSPKATRIAFWKGLMERFVLFLGLAAGVQQVLIVFGALKVGTYIRNDGDAEKMSKDFYLIGNLMTVAVAISDDLLWKWLSRSLDWAQIQAWQSC